MQSLNYFLLLDLQAFFVQCFWAILGELAYYQLILGSTLLDWSWWSWRTTQSARIEPRPVLCMVNALPAVLSFHFQPNQAFKRKNSNNVNNPKTIIYSKFLPFHSGAMFYRYSKCFLSHNSTTINHHSWKLNSCIITHHKQMK